MNRRLILLLFCVLLPLQCAHFGARTGEREQEYLVLVASTDFHSQIESAEGLAVVVRDLKERYGDHMLYLNGGDMFQGSMEGNLSEGRALIDLFNLLPLDASAIGNHEMDFGDPREQLKGTRFTWLAANFIESPAVRCEPGPGCNALRQKTLFEPRSVFVRGGRRVGVIGITTPETMNITRRDALKGVSFEDMRKTIEAEADFLRRKELCDWVVVLIHEGVYQDSAGNHRTDKGLYPLLEKLRETRLDAVIGGHTHHKIQRTIHGVPVLEAGRGEVVGVLRLEGLNSFRRTSRFEPWIPVPDDAHAPDVTAAMKPYRDMTARVRNLVIGSLAGPFPLAYQEENPVCNLMADALLSEAKLVAPADFAVLNAGGIRNSLPQGTVRYEDLFKAVPFDNNLVIVEMTGAEVRRLLEITLSGELGLAAVSGLTVQRLNVPQGVIGPWDRDLNGDGKADTWERNLIREIRDSNGDLIDDKRVYRLASISFLVQGGDYCDAVFGKIPTTRIQNYDEWHVRDLIAQYFSRKPDISPADHYDPGQPRIELLPVELPPGTMSGDTTYRE